MNTLKKLLFRILGISKEEDDSLKKIAHNTGWLSIDRVISMVVGLFIGAWVARYLGPTRYGLLNYALSFIGLFAPISVLGLKDIAVREIVQQQEKKDEILGTTFVLRLIGGLVCIIAALGVAYFLRSGEKLVLFLIAIVSTKILFNSFQAIDYWFQSQVESKYTVWAKKSAYFVVVAVKIVLILLQAPLVAFAFAIMIQAALASLVKVYLYNYQGQSFRKWNFQIDRAKSLLKSSWPLIVSGVAVAIYMKVDRIMLGNMVSDQAVGVYSAAAKLSETWYFIPTAIATSVFPALLKTKESVEHLYEERMQLLYDLMAFVSYAVAIPLALVAGPLITLLFGAEYAAAGPILTVHVWAFIFVSLGVARGRWLVAEDMQIYSMVLAVIGAITNVALNIILIPKFAGLGAAWATLLSYLVAVYPLCATTRKLRPVFKQMTLALLLPFRIKSFWREINEII